MDTIVERLTGKYDGVTFPEFMTEGSLSGGRNVRKVSPMGGWKPRKGYSLLNTTAAGTDVLGVWGYRNKTTRDYHLISQIDGALRDSTSTQEDLLTESGETILTEGGLTLASVSSSDPFTQATSIGASLVSGLSAEQRGFGATVGGEFVYADGSGAPIIYGGQSPLCEAFLLASGSDFVEYSREVKDSLTSTYAVLPNSSTPVYYVCSRERASGLLLNFAQTNSDALTVTVAAYRSGSWTNVSSQSDGTSGTNTHDTDGTISWTASSSDAMTILGNKMGYWYRVTFSGALSTQAVRITQCRVVRTASRMSNKWDGTLRYPTGAMFYDASAGVYEDRLGAVTSVSEDEYMDLDAGTTDDFVYIKTPEPAAIFGLAIPKGQNNGTAGNVDAVEYWNGSAWTSIAFSDTTLMGGASFAQTGMISFTARHTPAKLILDSDGDNVPGYWYRLSWDATLSAGTQIYTIVYGSQPADLENIAGVVEFQGRAIYWGHPLYPNRLILSPYERPDEVAALEDSLSQPCGSGEVIACGVLQDTLVIIADRGVFASTDGTTIQTVSNAIGIVARASFAVSEFGDRKMNTERIQSVALWTDADGVYKFDKTGLSKISPPVDQYFNKNYDEVLTAAQLQAIQATVNPLNNEYCLVLPDRELVYALATDEWYPPWYREIPLRSINSVKDSDDLYRLVGGSQDGFLLLMEETSNDRDTSNTEVAIEHSIITRALVASTPHLEFCVRKLWTLFKVQSSGDITCKIYGNHASTGVEEYTPSMPSLASATQDYTIPYVDLSTEESTSIRVEFSCNTLNVEMWILWISLMVEPTSYLADTSANQGFAYTFPFTLG
jgi:hypothetical protein